ncbi:MAG: YciI-like protein [Acidimicrobiales bacterium]
MHWLLTYDYVDDIATRRAPFREGHLGLVRELHDRGALLMAGAVGDPIEGALLVFTVEDQAVVEDFVAQDPYVREGLVTAWRVRPWNVVVGQAT